ncbi:Lrp/AsnC family transcriptional regulator [Bradyrhizobium monzae]|uniref:Lrp/AsnC family transcriptional regulator n=1 Tax=Bradyrhizobium sp. Oc8 TaxID=2876780 RepID=UPI001F195CC3|nr:Lrp/AsnC family transcriptional regulator [Bradyrhizobium sp. Oc8]
MKITNKDRQLLALLQQNAREPIASLARQLGVSRTTLQERIKRLEANGVIDGYALRLGKCLKQDAIHCFTLAAVDHKCDAEVGGQLKAIPAVQTVYVIAGSWDLIIHIVAGTLEQLSAELTRLNQISGIMRAVSHIIIGTKFDRNIYRDSASTLSGKV